MWPWRHPLSSNREALMEEKPKRPSINGRGVWQQFTIQDGLPDMKIECIYEDSQGILWIGTHDRGVVRYDGREFQTFTRQDGLSGDGVFSVIEDESGTLWFGTNGGITAMDGGAFVQLEGTESLSCLWGVCVSDGAIWFGLEKKPAQSPAVCRVWGKQREVLFAEGDPPDAGGSIHRTVSDGMGSVLCAGQGVFLSSDESMSSISSLDSLIHVNDMLLRSDGSIWISEYRGIFKYEPSEDRIECISSNRNVEALAEDADGVVWLCGNNGKLWSWDPVAGFEEKLDLDAVFWRGMIFDHRGRLWIGSYGSGLVYYEETRIQVFGCAQGLPNERIRNVALDKDKRVWVGTESGLAVVGNSSIEPVGAQLLAEEKISSLEVDRSGRLWIGTRAGHVITYFNGEFTEQEAVREFERYSISKLAVDSLNRVWFASRHGLGFGYYDDGIVQHYPATQEENYPTWVGAMAADKDGHIWIGSAEPSKWSGLCRAGDSELTRYPLAEALPISSLCVEDQVVWIGSSEGLFSLHRRTGSLCKTTQRLSCQIVTAITVASNGTLWIGTEGGGVNHYDGTTVQAIQIPGDVQRNVINDICEDVFGDMWIATNCGLVRFQRTRMPPSAEILSVLGQDEQNGSEEVRAYKAGREITIRFSGYSPDEHTSHLTFLYRLVGCEDDWNQTDETSVSYAGLKPGSYRFDLRAVDRDLNRSEIACVELSIAPTPMDVALNEALSGDSGGQEFIGHSACILEVMDRIKDVAPSDLTVSIFGETGTGKGLIARAVHALSDRKLGPFVSVNCGALPEGLVDSQLFGHERGAFTGASARRVGKFELADSGSIFLDEIGDLPIESQARLLHVLQELSIERVGGSRQIPVSVRVIAATNRDLPQAVQEGYFREDLFYRLNVFAIEMPPLRRRREDIGELAEFFVARFAEHLNQRPPKISSDAMKILTGYEWPGNVRELEHMMQRAVLLAKSDVIQLAHLPSVAEEQIADQGSLVIQPWAAHERRYLEQVLDQTEGVIYGDNGAAALLEIHPNTLRSRLNKLGIKVRKKKE